MFEWGTSKRGGKFKTIFKNKNIQILRGYFFHFSCFEFPAHQLHCGMRGQSSCLVMATNQNLGIRVLFSPEFNGIVQIPVFRQAQHYKIIIFSFWTILHNYVYFLAFLGKFLSILIQLHHQPEQPMFWRPAYVHASVG